MPKKLNIAVIFGGRSGEHEVSLASATAIIKNLDRRKYNIIPIGISKTGPPTTSRYPSGLALRVGEWLAGPDVLEKFKDGLKDRRGLRKVIIDPTGNFKILDPLSVSLCSAARNRRRKWGLKEIDAIFPILHGTYGEDGTIQGLFEIMNVPYVGAGVLGSAVGMDKIIQKKILQQEKLPVVDFVEVKITKRSAATCHRPWRGLAKGDDMPLSWRGTSPRATLYCATQFYSQIINKVGLPCFVKPANMGSSVGISKAHNLKELEIALSLAKKYDNKIIIEKAVPNLREFECAILGNENPKASKIGEILASNEFYDYNAKYVDGKSKTIIPAKINKNLSEKIRNLAVVAYKTLNCAGMARMDFLYNSKNDILYINEANTIPGFTKISMYPKLWEASGIKYQKLLDKLIALAIKRHKQRNKLLLSYKPSKKWY